MKAYRLKDTTVINLDYIQSIDPVNNDGYGNFQFRIQMYNYYITPVFKTKNEAIEQRDHLILELQDGIGW